MMCCDNYYSLFISCFSHLCWNMISTASFITLLINRYNNWLLPLLRYYLLILHTANNPVDHRTNCPTFCFNQFCWNMTVPGDLCLYSFPIAISTYKALGWGTGSFAVCVLVCLTSLTLCTFSSWEEWFLHLARILWESGTISTFLILYYISFRMVTPLKVTDAPVQVCDILFLTVCFKVINWSFQKSPTPFFLFGSTVPTLICWICRIILLCLLIMCIKCCMDFLHPPQVLSPSSLTLRLLMSYIYGAPILDVSRSHTTTQHSR